MKHHPFILGVLGLLCSVANAKADSCGGSFVTGYSAPPLSVDVFGAADTTVTSTIPVNV